MTEFFCIECANKSDDLESLCIGILGVRECVCCGHKVNCSTEGYSVFREGAKERLKEKESKC